MRDYKESKVGKLLSEYTTRKVILLVLAMLFSTPAMAVDSYLEEPDSYAYGLSLIKEFGPSKPSGQQAFIDTVMMQQSLSTPLVQLYCDDGIKALNWEVSGFDIDKMRHKDIYRTSLEDVPSG